jgi:hypothetical protein
MIIRGGPTDIPLNRKCPIISKTVDIPTQNHRYKAVGFSGSDIPCMLHEIVTATKENEMHIIIKRKSLVLAKMTQVSDVAHGRL